MARVHVVTGSASGIGKATTEFLRSCGERVISVDVKDADVLADLSTPEGRSHYTETIARSSGGTVDAVIAVAGTVLASPVTVAVNYFGAIATLEGARPLLARSQSPRAVVVSSLAAAVSPTDVDLLAALLAEDEAASLMEAERIGAATDSTGSGPIYATTKYAISRWVRKHAPGPEWAEQGIALNAVAPGVIRTPMTQSALDTEEGLSAMKARAPAPLNGPAAKPEDIASLLAYLASPENRFVSGQVIYADGGAEAISRPELV